MYDITNPTNSGRIVAVWSPVSRQGAVSTTAALLASYLAKTEPQNKVLVLSNDSTGGTTAAYYMTKERMINGLAEVIELSISDNLKSAEDIYKNTYSLYDNIDVLSCSKNNTNVADFLSREIENILNVARKGYRYIIVDTVYGQFDPSTHEILRNSDVVIACLPQDKFIIDQWARKMPEIYPADLDKKHLILLSAMHFEYSTLNYEIMQRELHCKDLFYLSLNDVVHTGVSKRNIPNIITTNMKVKNPDDAYIEIAALADRVTEYIDSIIEHELSEEHEIAQQSKEETKKYIESNNDFFMDMGYDSDEPEDSDQEAGSPEASEASEVDEPEGESESDTGVSNEPKSRINIEKEEQSSEDLASDDSYSGMDDTDSLYN